MLAAGPTGRKLTMRISVIIATRNRVQQLARCLESFDRVAYGGAWEVVVVDNNSTDETANYIRENQGRFRFDLVYCLETKPGPSSARNTGASKSRGEILVFTDDDCYPAEDYLECVDHFFSSQPEVGFGGGRVLLHDPTDLPLTLQEQNQPKDLIAGSFLVSGVIHGANMVFRREVFYSVQGFDEVLGPGRFFCSGEDTDLLRRTLCLGFTGKYDPSLVIYHHHGRKTSADQKKLQASYDRGMGAGFMKQLLYRPQKRLVLKMFYWHLQTMPLARRLRQVWYFVLYGCHAVFSPVGVQSHQSGLGRKSLQ